MNRKFTMSFVILATMLLLWGTSCDQSIQPLPPDNKIDTTSHNFVWKIDTLGDGNSSVLNDVTIINDTLAYAVGEISVKDSTGQFMNPPYNIARWDGKKWKLFTLLYNCRLYFPSCGPVTDLFAPASSIVAFNPHDIWITAGSIHHYDGAGWNQLTGVLGIGSAYKIWGNNSSNLWFVGKNGFLVHFDGNQWSKLESGTTLDLQDIWGAYDEVNRKTEIIAIASNLFENAGKEVLTIEGASIIKQSTQGLGLYYSSIWFLPSKKYFIAGGNGSGLFSSKTISANNFWQKENITEYYLESVRGANLSDIVVAGHGGEIMHWNGVNWHSYREYTLINGVYKRVAIKNNLVIAVGYEQGRGIIAVGKRR